MKQIQKGFTLIELIIVIVILGILAAVALPKFIDLSKDARVATVKGLNGSMNVANQLIYAKAAIAGQTGATGTATVNGTVVSTVYGFAATVAPDLIAVMDLDTTAYTTAAAGITVTNSPTPATCGVAYTAATATTTPVYAVNLGGC